MISDRDFLDIVQLNQARVLSGEGSPKILIGSMGIGECPNFHTIPMIQMGASVVSLCLEKELWLRPDRLVCMQGENIVTAMERLPQKWKPDFFWDSQVEHGHHFPLGLGQLPIPTIASFNHAHFGQALLHLEGMFDCLVRPSQEMAGWGDAYLPWGGSWGSMEGRIAMFANTEPPKDVREYAVSCTIGTSIGRESVRHKVVAEMQAIKERRKDWNVALLSGLSQEEYFKLLARSRVSINVGAWGCTMTYRPLEIIAQESALVHVDETGYGSTSTLREFFPESWYTSATPETLEAAIATALKVTPEVRREIRRDLVEWYSYEEQYERLFRLAGGVKAGKRFDGKDWSRRAYAVNFLTGFYDLASNHHGALDRRDLESVAHYQDRDWDVSLWQPSNGEERFKWQTELALRKRPHREVYREYSEREKTCAR